MSGANSIKVVARFRPQNRVENESGGQPIVKFDGDDTVTIDVRAPILDSCSCSLWSGGKQMANSDQPS